MKINKTILLCGLGMIMAGMVNSQNVYIPDPIFKNYLVNHTYLDNPNNPSGGTWVSLDANHDGEIQETEANSYLAGFFVHGFVMNNLAIADMTGIEAFQSIESLRISNCPIESLVIDDCTSLNSLVCTGSSLTTFNLNHNTLEELEISGNPSLSSINLSGFGLSSLKINFNPILTEIQLSIHPELTLFQCYNNAINTLDLSGCSGMEQLFCTGNQLSSLNLSNGAIQSFQQIVCNGYPELTCIQVDNVTVANYLWGGGYPYEFDSWASFNTDCTPPGPCVVDIPDPNFKAALLANSLINTNANTEIECTEAIAYTGEINLDNTVISDLKGIEAFVNITSLSTNNIQINGGATPHIDTLDVHNFTSLTSLSCTGNANFKYLNASGCTDLTDVNVSTWLENGVSVNLDGCTSIESLNLNNKRLNALTINGCTALTSIDCSNNLLSALDISSNAALTTLNCSNNLLENLMTYTNSSLTTLNCSNNLLPFLFVATNAALSTLDCSHNLLTYIDFTNNADLISINCSNNNLATISVNNNPILNTLDCSYNNLSVLNVSLDTQLNTLDCSYNQLESVDVSQNALLQILQCDGNNLPQIDISANAALHTLSCAENHLTSIDVSNNLILKSLSCENNLLSILDVSANTALLELLCSSNQLTSLNLQNCTSLINLVCDHNTLIDLDLSNTFVLLLSCQYNNLESLNIANGHNTTAIMIAANNNSNLTCIQVDDADYSTTNWLEPGFVFDAGVNFSENCEAMAINEANVTTDYIVYPNPSNGTVYFSEQRDIRISNTMGQILSEKKNVSSFDLSKQPAGVYFIQFMDGDGRTIYQSKVVKE